MIVNPRATAVVILAYVFCHSTHVPDFDTWHFFAAFGCKHVACGVIHSFWRWGFDGYHRLREMGCLR